MPLHPDAKALIGDPKLQPHDWNVAEVRESEFNTISLGGDPIAIASVEDVPIADCSEIKLKHFRPFHASGGPALLWFPGGGFVCPPIAYDGPMRRLCDYSGRDVYLAHFRLAPEYPFPAQFEDAPLILQRALDHQKEIQSGTTEIHVGGDSSGGNIAASLVLHADELLRSHIVSTCLIYPMLDATCSQPSYSTYDEGFGFTARKSAWYFKQWIGTGNIGDVRASPYSADDLTGFGKCFIASAECDPLRDEAEAFAGRLIAAGNQCDIKRYAGMIHGFFQMPGALEKGVELIEDIAAFVRADAGNSKLR